MSTFLLVEQTAPDTPSTNQVIMYAKSDGLMYTKDDTGTEYLVSIGTSGTFTATGTGFSGADPTVTASYRITNTIVTLTIPTITGTSDTTAFTVTGAPAAIRPATQHTNFLIGYVDNSGAGTAGRADIETSGTITLYTSFAAGGWTASGTKTLGNATFTYSLI